MEQTDYSTAVNVFLNPSADETVMETELAAVGFADRSAAAACLLRLAATPETRTALAQALPALLNALSEVADPNPVLVNIERFVKNIEKPIDLYHDFAQNPRLPEILTTIFSGSRFLTEILLHRPHYFERLTAHQQLAQQKEAHEFRAEVQAKIKLLLDTEGPTDPVALFNALRRFQRWELLRIGVADLLG
ncbi:MAG: hypothetical protein R3264_10080, partial [Anaerolineae bacterium]|nr:hypothetical protein [Anaerolineae bacterium]